MKTRAFNATKDEVTLILGSETGQLWRPMKPQPVRAVTMTLHNGRWWRWVEDAESLVPETLPSWRCPFGVPGDVFWVRETWRQGKPMINGPDRDSDVAYRADYLDVPALFKRRIWRSSVTMPRWASRIDLEVVAVRAKQVQEVTEEEARACGCKSKLAGCRTDGKNGARHVFHNRWDSLYAKRGLGWETNPWAWRFDYRRLKPCT